MNTKPLLLHHRTAGLALTVLLLLSGLLLASPPPTARTVSAAPGDTITVTTTGDAASDSAADCTGASPTISCPTLRAAIAFLNTNDADTIDLSGLSGTITLAANLPTIQNDVTITGPGATSLTIDGDATHSIINVDTSITATISGLTLTRGTGTIGGAVTNNGTLTLDDMTITSSTATFQGGGIRSNGTLTITNSTIGTQGAPNSSGDRGGGVYSVGDTTITATTIAYNTADSDGGGIYHTGGVLTIRRSTISNNSANASGGALYIERGESDNIPTLDMVNSTISNNAAQDNGSAIYFSVSFFSEDETGPRHSIAHSTIVRNFNPNEATIAALEVEPTEEGGSMPLDLYHTIVAGNFTDGCSFSVNDITSLGYNLFGEEGNDGGCPANGSTDIVPASGVFFDDVVNSLLEDNGGPTFTHALPQGSPAIDSGLSGITVAPATDQRGTGFGRILDGDGDSTAVIDIGAYEAPAVVFDFSVSKAAAPASLPEPGGDFTYTITVTNTGTVPIVTQSLLDDRFGDLDNPGSNVTENTCSSDITIPPSGEGNPYTCSFVGTVTGEPQTHTNTITVTATASGLGSLEPLERDDDAEVQITNVDPDITVTVVADPDTVTEPDGDVTFNVTVTNNSPIDEDVDLATLNDSILGDVLQSSPIVNRSNATLQNTLTSTTCQNTTITTTTPYTCQYLANLTGTAGTTQDHTLTATAQDNDDASDTADATDTVSFVEDPTAIALMSFTARPVAAGVQLAWETSIEINTRGFALLRGDSPDRAAATRITADLIGARGNAASGASYRYTDTTADPDGTYYYWLQEEERDGTTNLYGPATVGGNPANNNRTYLPLVRR